MRIYDKKKHLELIDEKSTREVKLREVALKLHDEHGSDEWSGEHAPAKFERYMVDQKFHEQLMREITYLDTQIQLFEEIKPIVNIRSDANMMDVRRRWMQHGGQGLEKDERDLFVLEPTKDMLEQIPVVGQGGEVFAPFVMAAGDPLRSDLDTGDDSAAGLAAPETWAQDIVERLAYYGAVAASCHNFTTANGNDLHQNQLDTSDEEGGAIADQSQVAGTGVPQMAHDQIGPVNDIVYKSYWRHSNFMSVRLESLSDLHFDVAGRVMREASRRMGRGWNKSFTVGNGTDKPEGIVQSATVVDGGAGSADDGSGGIDYANLLQLLYAVDLAYLEGMEVGEGGFTDAHGGMIGWMMNRNVERQLRAAVDLQNRPIWMPFLDVGSANQRAPGNILGHPYQINQHMDDGKTADDLPLLFGSLGHYAVRNIGGPMFYRFFDSRTMTRMAVDFIGLSRRDGRSRGPTVAMKNEAYAVLEVKA